RREDESVRSELATYQDAIKRLTGENSKLKADLAASKAAHQKDVRALRSQLREGLTPEILALREQVERQADRAQSAVGRSQETLKAWFRLSLKVQRVLVTHFGANTAEASVALHLLASSEGLEPLP